MTVQTQIKTSLPVNHFWGLEHVLGAWHVALTITLTLTLTLTLVSTTVTALKFKCLFQIIGLRVDGQIYWTDS